MIIKEESQISINHITGDIFKSVSKELLIGFEEVDYKIILEVTNTLLNEREHKEVFIHSDKDLDGLYIIDKLSLHVDFLNELVDFSASEYTNISKLRTCVLVEILKNREI